MSQVLLEDPTSQLARLVEQVSRGEEVIILRDSTPVAKIVLLSEKNRQRKRRGGRSRISATPKTS